MTAVALPRRSGLALLAALFVAALALRPQLVGAGPLIPEISDELAVSHAVAGLLGTIPVLCMGAFAPAAAPLAGRLGLRGVITACIAAVAVFGVARATVPGAPLLLLLTFPVGIGMAVAGALLPIAVKLRFPDRPAFASGVCTTGLNLGAALSAAVAVPGASALGGWRGALAAFSVLTFVLCAGWIALSRGAWGERSAARVPRLPVRRPVVWMIVAVFGLQSLVYYGFTAWMPDAFQERGWSPAAAGALLAVMGASTLAGGLGVPWLADRGGSRRAWLLGSAALAVASTFGLAALPGAGFAWAVGTGVAVGALFPLCLTMCLDVAHEPAEVGAAAALMFLAGYLIAAAAPLGLGAVRDLTGSFATSLWALFATALLLLAACAPLSPARLRPT
jgi:MFS transporter, CP family, cyanate transporter